MPDYQRFQTPRLDPPPSMAGWRAWAYRLVRCSLAAVFLYTGLTKLLAVRAFAVVLSRYGLVPEPLLAPAAVGLPLLEVLAGLGLIFDVRGSLTAITAMLLVFMAALWFGVLQGLEIDCGCYSPGELAEQGSLRRALYRDFVFLAMAGYLYWARRRFRALAGTGPSARENREAGPQTKGA